MCLCSTPEYLAADLDGTMLFTIEVNDELRLVRGAPTPFVSPSTVCPEHEAMAW